jgi:hypothetical protein
VTLAPLVAPDVRGAEGKPGAVGEACAAPGCTSASQQRHHIWPKSYLRGQPVEWVEVGGVLLQNTVGLCAPCHAAVTGVVGGHRAHIRYDRDRGLYEWWAKEGEDWAFVGFLRDQALVQEPEARPVRRQEGLCGECGRPLRTHDSREQKLGIKPRRVKPWAVVVPDDTEVGSDVMDDWIDQFSMLLGFGEAPTRLRRYHVLAVLLAWAAQNTNRLLSDLEEADYFAA